MRHMGLKSSCFHVHPEPRPCCASANSPTTPPSSWPSLARDAAARRTTADVAARMPPGRPHGEQAAEAAAARGPGGIHPRPAWRLPAGPPRPPDQRGGHPRCTGRPAGADRMRHRPQPVRPAGQLQRGRQLAAHQPGDPPVAAGNHARRTGGPGKQPAPFRPVRREAAQWRGRRSESDDARTHNSKPYWPVATSTASSPTSNPTPIPPGLDEETVRFISAKKKEPQFLLDWRLRALERWLTMKEPHWAKLQLPAHRLPGDLLLLRAQGEHRRTEVAWRRWTRSCWPPTRSSACRCMSARGWPAWRWMPCSTACRWPPPSRNAWPQRA